MELIGSEADEGGDPEDSATSGLVQLEETAVEETVLPVPEGDATGFEEAESDAGI